MTDEAEASRQRFREALQRREDDGDHYRQRLADAGSLSEYLAIQSTGGPQPRQEVSNMGYSAMKKRR